MLKVGVKHRNFLIALFVLIVGILCNPVAGGLNELFVRVLGASPLVVSPFVEEPVKMIPLVILGVFLRVRVKKYQWIIWGMIAALGLAVAEAYEYIFWKGTDPLLRILPAAGHVIDSGIVSIGFVLIPNISLNRGPFTTRFKKAFGSIISVNFLSFLAMGITSHALWNLQIKGFPIESQFLFIMLSAVILFSLAKIFIRK